MLMRIFGPAIAVTAVSLLVAFLYGGPKALILCAILGVFEVTLSFDNAVVNATVLRRMSEFWQKIFITVGILIAVFGMRLVFPMLVVWITAGLNPARALQIALNPPADGAMYFPDGSPSYETALTAAHPQIAAFGGMFLMMLFLNFVFSEREITWLGWLERPLGRAGKLDQLAAAVALIALVVAAEWSADEANRTTVLIAGVLGVVSYIVVDGLGSMFDVDEDELMDAALAEDAEGTPAGPASGPSQLAVATGKAGFFLFLYLEVLDASFSFDGVIGAFAITSDPIIIALGLGFIGAMFVRSLTIFLVRKGTLSEYVYLEHGAYWAIGALALILLVSIGTHVNEVFTGLIGLVLIAAAFLSSIVRNRRIAAAEAGDRVPTLTN